MATALKRTSRRNEIDRETLVYEQLSAMLLAVADLAKPDAMAVTWKDGVAVAVDIPGVLSFKVLDVEFAKSAHNYPCQPDVDGDKHKNVIEWEKSLISLLRRQGLAMVVEGPSRS